MTSLAHSLLALALVALLQTVTAIFPRWDLSRKPRCTEALFGKRSPHPDGVYKLPPIYITQANSDVTINDYPGPGYEVIGGTVVVCNRGAGPKPRVSLVSPDNFDVVNVMLGFGVPPPIYMDMTVTRYLKPTVPFLRHGDEINYN